MDNYKNNKKTALISVYNKEGIVEFASELAALGFNLIASGGTAKALLDAGLKVRDVSELVGGKAILGHRVVTLSREVHAGLMARDIAEDIDELERLGIPRIDLVCVDLYPLKDEITRSGSTEESVIEKTDVGGPSMIHSAAKGRRIVVCSLEDRRKVIEWIKDGCPDEHERLRSLAARAEFTVADYCFTSARYLDGEKFSGMLGRLALRCKYGENAVQAPAGLYSAGTDDPLAIDKFKVVSGIEPSYNNICDIDRLLQTITHIAAAFDINFSSKKAFIAAAAKHGNPCGASAGESSGDVLKNMIRGDKRAIFGGVVMTNISIGEEEAEILLTYLMDDGKRRLLDSIIAPEFSPAAIERLRRKGDKCRLIENPALKSLDRGSLDVARRLRYVRGGFLSQPNYTYVLNLNNDNIEKTGEAAPALEADIALAWAIGATSNSNTVCLVKDGYLIGNAVGQQDRVGACELAVKRARDAGHDINSASAYSDSFFPALDGPEVLIKNGIKAVLVSSGSIMDDKVREVFKENGVALYMVPDKIGRGFFGH